jgi:hypothetical protein
MNNSLGGRQYAIIVLTVITAAIHLFLGISSLPDTFGYVFILNGISYLALLIALYFIPQLAPRRALIRWLLLAFAAVTFVLYFVFNWPDIWSPLGIVTKADELVLIVLLFLDRNSP